MSNLIAILFETGCRISEALQLEPDMFKVEEDFVMVYGAPVFKKGNGGLMTKQKKTYPFP